MSTISKSTQLPSLGSIRPRHIAAIFGVALVVMQLTREAFLSSDYSHDSVGRELFEGAPSYDRGATSSSSSPDEDGAAGAGGGEPLFDENDSNNSNEEAPRESEQAVQELVKQLHDIQVALEQQQTKLRASEEQQEQQVDELKQLKGELAAVKKARQEQPVQVVKKNDDKEKDATSLASTTAKVVEELRAEFQSLKDQVVAKVIGADTINNNNTSKIISDTPVPTEFVRQEGVVIATKIHGEHQLHILEQMLCLLTKAYNDRMKYDVLVFTTEPISKESEKSLHVLGAPARVTIVVDNPGLHKMIKQLSPARKQTFLSRCGVETDAQLKNMTWFSECRENGIRGGLQRIAYCWQAEFRALHIWKHPALKPYKTMMWIDADAFPTKVWDRDPIAFFREHQLVIAFQNFPAGRSPGGQPEFVDRFMTSFGKTITDIELVDGHLTAKEGKGALQQIHGFMHITDLDFYRSKRAIKWSETLIGDDFLSRRFDDQLAVTAPAVVWAPERSWHLGSHGISLRVFHNGMMDGGERAPKYNFRAFWHNGGGKEGFPQANGVCPIEANGR